LKRVIILAAAAVLCACGGVKFPPYGGDKELALANATVAVDVAKVSELLRSGADPNKMVRVDGDPQSAWYLALDRLRPRRADTVAIVKAMLASGASPESAWGTGGRHPGQPEESKLRRFLTTGARQAGTGEDTPITMAMMYPVPEIVRALMAAGLNPRHAETALVAAIEGGEVEIAHILVDAGVDVNCHPGANTPLVAAIEARNVALMTYLEDHGAREKP
jgi:hypothetical protein